ncbi:MAG TPA: glycosyltransferase N-terminal domain-containing protein [Gemmatimonadales bacterium]|nr:glycosyltransferase N-terminal domain-containing protein [Gemmatimonadales bacterium]
MPASPQARIVPAVPTTSPLYRAATSMAVPLVPVVLRDARAREAHRGRIGAPAALAAWAAGHRDMTRPLAWFHASSVGEGLQARAVLERFRRARPDAQIVYTHYSPSATAFAATVAADWSGYVPYDRPADVATALDAVRPDLLVFAKLDLWPELATAAAARGAAVTLIAGTVSPNSGRLRFPLRALAAPGYAALACAGAIADKDAERLVRLGCDPARITVTGDPRIDSVLDAVAAIAPDGALHTFSNPEHTLVAGSTWPADEAVVLAALALVRVTHPDARLILVPHDPTEEHLRGVELRAEQHGVACVRMSAHSASDTAPLLLVDRVGLLARLYGSGSMALVGGGWGDKGIHSVLEPAAWALPVTIGPRDRGSRDAQLLDAAGALVRLPEADAPHLLAGHWSRWLAEPAEREQKGRAARHALEGERGAAERSVSLLLAALEVSARSRRPG